MYDPVKDVVQKSIGNGTPASCTNAAVIDSTGLSSIGVSWVITDSVMTNNRATGNGATLGNNPSDGFEQVSFAFLGPGSV